MIILIFCIVILFYVIFCAVLYLQQEKLIFFPEKLPQNFQFQFRQNFEEVTIPVGDDINLHGLLFTTDNSKGLIFYLHGNAGSLAGWGSIAQIYTDLDYDIFILDYRGYGKSEGKIYCENQFHRDIQVTYDTLKVRYAENKIVIIGYSIGTGPAARLASENNPQMLILQAPYYSLIDMMHYRYTFVPSFILRYSFKTWKFLKRTRVPVTIFHGKKDNVIYYESSLKLKKFLKPDDHFITLRGQNHQGMNYNKVYIKKLASLLINQK